MRRLEVAAVLVLAALLPGCAATIGGQGSRAGGIQQGSQAATEQRPAPAPVAEPAGPAVAAGESFPAHLVVGGVAVSVPMSPADVREWIGAKLVGGHPPAIPRSLTPAATPTPGPSATEPLERGLYWLNPGGDAFHRDRGCKFVTDRAYPVVPSLARSTRRPCRTCGGGTP